MTEQPPPRTALTRAVDQWLAHLQVERGRSEHTLKAYRRDLGRYAEHLTQRGIEDPARVREQDIADFLATLREGTEDHPPLAASSAARTMAAVRGLHRFLAVEGMVGEDQAQPVTPPKPPARLPKALTIDQVEALLDAASVGGTPASVRDRAILELLYAAGARVSELTALDLDDVDLDEGLVRLFGKGRKERVVPIGRFAREALEAYVVRVRPALVAKGRGGPAVFVSQRGSRIGREAVWRIIRRAADRAGLTEHVSPHVLRHSFATHLLEGGADIRVVQELLGHASVTTTQIYTKVTVQQLREVFAAAHPRAR